MNQAQYSDVLEACRARGKVQRRHWGLQRNLGGVWNLRNPEHPCCAIGAYLVGKKVATLWESQDGAGYLGCAANEIASFILGFDGAPDSEFTPATEWHSAGKRLAAQLIEEGILS